MGIYSGCRKICAPVAVWMPCGWRKELRVTLGKEPGRRLRRLLTDPSRFIHFSSSSTFDALLYGCIWARRQLT